MLNDEVSAYQDDAWFRANYGLLGMAHQGKWVAIVKQSIIAEADTRAELERALNDSIYEQALIVKLPFVN